MTKLWARALSQSAFDVRALTQGKSLRQVDEEFNRLMFHPGGALPVPKLKFKMLN